MFASKSYSPRRCDCQQPHANTAIRSPLAERESRHFGGNAANCKARDHEFMERPLAGLIHREE
jgi:hypothetical protein